MARTRRFFTLEQANAMARAIRPLLAEILEIRQDIQDREPEFWPVLIKAVGNGGSKEASQAADQFRRLERLAKEINATGAILKDLNTGLVDFPSRREGREIYLCWQYGEERIAYWHEIDAGFAGRQLID